MCTLTGTGLITAPIIKREEKNMTRIYKTKHSKRVLLETLAGLGWDDKSLSRLNINTLIKIYNELAPIINYERAKWNDKKQLPLFPYK